MANEYRQHVRALGDCVRKPDWKSRGKTEIDFLNRTLWPAFKSMPHEVRQWEPEIKFAVQQLKIFFDDGPVDEAAASIFSWFLSNTLDRPNAESHLR